MAKSALVRTDMEIDARHRKVRCGIPPSTIRSGMAREMIWINHAVSWGCSGCAWAFIPSGSPIGDTIDEMMVNFVSRRDKEFASHVCAAQSRTQPRQSE
jgi:hypothetical protein